MGGAGEFLDGIAGVDVDLHQLASEPLGQPLGWTDGAAGVIGPLVILFVLVTSPLSTHAIVQAARARQRRRS